MQIERTRYYRISEVAHLLGDVHRTTVWRMIKRGDLPQPIRFTEKLTVISGDQLADALDAMRQREAA